MTDAQKLRNTKLFLLDMDGTLYLGNTVFPYTKEFLQTVKNSGRRYMFITNNSSKSVEDYIKKLESLGISSTREDFQTSSMALIYYLQKHNVYKNFYVCGTASLKKELANAGFTVTENREQANGIIIGYDSELTYKKLEDVSYLLCTKKDIFYIATNPDYVCPTEFGSVPDCGSMCDMLYNVARRRPIMIGKPEPLMITLAAEKAGVPLSQTAVVGDRIYTDVKSGINAGALGVLVLSGETTVKMLEDSSVKPSVVIDDISKITDALCK
ncbi:MAG: HAD-IIA family hydrolase [Oscillospiraceae bacterium]|nr:HAD-IIA family hydrolase [Candidatus Equicaccousia limihippi]